MAEAEAAAALARAEARVAQAEARPTLSVGGGLRYLGGGDRVAFVAESTVEVPIFDRGREAVQAANDRARAAELAVAAAQLAVERERQALQRRLRAALEEETTLRFSLLPAAAGVRDGVNAAYLAGTATFADLAASRRDCLEMESRRAALAAEAQRLAALLEALGRGVEPSVRTASAAHEEKP